MRGGVHSSGAANVTNKSASNARLRGANVHDGGREGRGNSGGGEDKEGDAGRAHCVIVRC